MYIYNTVPLAPVTQLYPSEKESGQLFSFEEAWFNEIHTYIFFWVHLQGRESRFHHPFEKQSWLDGQTLYWSMCD